MDGPAPGYIRVTVTIVGKNGKIMYNSSKVDVKEKGTVLDALYATGVSCKVRSDGYVRAIAGLAENANGEGLDVFSEFSEWWLSTSVWRR